MQYNVLEARNQLSKLIDAAEIGEDVVIARRGKPVVRIVAIGEQPRRGTGAALAKVFADWEPLPTISAEQVDEELREIRTARLEQR